MLISSDYGNNAIMTTYNLKNPVNDAEDMVYTNELFLSRMRAKRNRLLEKSDWTQITDCTISNKTAWATYRQALREFPATWTPAETVTFPDQPT